VLNTENLLDRVCGDRLGDIAIRRFYFNVPSASVGVSAEVQPAAAQLLNPLRSGAAYLPPHPGSSALHKKYGLIDPLPPSAAVPLFKGDNKTQQYQRIHSPP